MAAPLFTIQLDSDARPFAFRDPTTKRLDKRFDVSDTMDADVAEQRLLQAFYGVWYSRLNDS